MEHLYPYIIGSIITGIIVIAITGFIGKQILGKVVGKYTDKLLNEDVLTRKDCDKCKGELKQETKEAKKEFQIETIDIIDVRINHLEQNISKDLVIIKKTVLAIAIHTKTPLEQFEDLVI